LGIQALTSFSLYLFINAFTPGPGNILALNTVTAYGWRKGKNLFFGIFAGYYCVQAICAIFTFGLDQLLNPVMGVLKYVGAAYIVWLAIHILRCRPEEAASDKKPSFWVGFVLQFVNVKIYLFGVTALSGYIVPYYSSLGMLLLFEMIIATVGTIATLTWIFFGVLLQKVYVKYYRPINIVLALFLLVCAVGILFS